jgi:hypothetical protein
MIFQGYEEHTAAIVALTMEYPWGAGGTQDAEGF